MRAQRLNGRQVSEAPLFTPDGRYLVVRGQLWRTSDPSLPAERREGLVAELMSARRAVGLARRTDDDEGERCARDIVDRVKHALGERGPVWWTDGAPDLNRHKVENTPYAAWFALQGDHDPR